MVLPLAQCAVCQSPSTCPCPAYVTFLFWTNILKSFTFPFPSENPFSLSHSLGVSPCCNSTKANLVHVFPYLSAKDPIKRDPDKSRSKGSYFLTKCSLWAKSLMWTTVFCRPMGSWWQTHLMCLLSLKTLFQQEISGPTSPYSCS